MTDPAGNLIDPRRCDFRVPMALRIRLRFEGQRGFIAGVLSDLSVGGMAIQCGFEPAVGSMLRFMFQAQGSRVEVKGQGSVVWKVPRPEAAGTQAGRTALGIKFLSLAKVDQEEVERIVAAEVVLKAQLGQAHPELTRLQLVSEQAKRRFGELLGAMRQSVQEKARARQDLEEQLRATVQFELGTAEEPLELPGTSSADANPGEREAGHREKKLRAAIDSLEDAKSQLREAEERCRRLEGTKARLAEELSDARVAQRDFDRKAVDLDRRLRRSAAAESSAALQVLTLEALLNARSTPNLGGGAVPAKRDPDHGSLSSGPATAAKPAYGQTLLVPRRGVTVKTGRRPNLLLVACTLLVAVLMTGHPSPLQKPDSATSRSNTLSAPSSRREERVDSVADRVSRERSARQAVARATESWARAWSEQRLDDYLGSYSAEFELPLSLDFAAWRSQTRSRLLTPRYIIVTLKNMVVEVQDDHHATASFSQTYESDSYGDEVRKSLSWVWERASWKIVAEATLSD